MVIVIHAPDIAAERLAGRTARSVAGWGKEVRHTATLAGLRDEHGPVLLLRAGAWLERGTLPVLPEGGFVGLGPRADAAWRRALAGNGGDFTRRRWLPFSAKLPELSCLWLPEPGLLPEDFTWERPAFSRSTRLAALPQLGGHWHAGLRVLQVVTTIQTGGAERVTLDLAAELNQRGIATAVAALDRPGREALPEPPWFYDLSAEDDRVAAVLRCARHWGADLIHAHLLRAAELREMKAAGWPVVAAVHNMRHGWPPDWGALTALDADLFFACAAAVERDLPAGLPARTVWNGIEAGRLSGARGAGPAAGGPVLLALANPRPQKRLHLLMPVLLELPDARLVIAGGPVDHASAVLARETAERLGVAARVEWPGCVGDTRALFARAHALVCTSAWEGLSLAQLEARAAGLAVVATDVGGTREIPGVHLVPAEFTAAEFAEAVRRAVAGREEPFPRSFTRHAMAARAAWLYPRVLAPQRKPGGLLLVANNFSTGGAQTSARRLLLALHGRGLPVRAVVVEEEPARPTPGRRALRAAGVPVLATRPLPWCDAADAVAQLLDHIDDDPPEVLVFWNLITSVKILLADALPGTRIVDVSPGGMFFTSLEKYFASPRTGLPYATAHDYGRRLAAVVVKYQAEAARAAAVLGAPVAVVPNGVRLEPSGAGKKAGGKLILVTTARLSPDKKLDELLAALRLAHAQLPPYEFHIAGGPERGYESHAKDLRRLARGLPVVWCGLLSDPRPLLLSADLFVMISEPPGCPNASLEALACGLPVIATDVGGVSEQVIDGVTGRLVPPGDAAAFAQALVEVAHDAAGREKMSGAARAHVADQFSLEKMVERYVAVFGLGDGGRGEQVS